VIEFFQTDMLRAIIGFLSTLLGMLGLVLKFYESRNAKKLKRMQSIPPTVLPEQFVREVTGKHAALDERLALLERTAAMSAKWTEEDLRKQLAEVGADHAKTAGALLVERENVKALQQTIDARNLKIASLQAQKLTLQHALEDRDVELGKLIAARAEVERERDDCLSRCLVLKDKLVERSTRPHSVELALDDDRLPTPLRPPALPKGKP
jgi:chromosome segregation ATPase